MTLSATLASAARDAFARSMHTPPPMRNLGAMRLLCGVALPWRPATEKCLASGGGQDVAIIFADIRLRGVMNGVDLAREVKMRWPFLPVVLTSGHPRERVGELPPGVVYMPKPWQPLNVLIAAERARASARGP
jgi:CheY-like chemotaxis protein